MFVATAVNIRSVRYEPKNLKYLICMALIAEHQSVAEAIDGDRLFAAYLSSQQPT